MSNYNVATVRNFWSADMIVGEVLSASVPENNNIDYFSMKGKKISQVFSGQKQSLEDFGNRYILRGENRQWIEFAYA